MSSPPPKNRELTTNLATADAAIREEMVLKIAVLAERYATDLRWYVDTVLQLIQLAGDYVADDVWHRVVQVRMGGLVDGRQVPRAISTWRSRLEQPHVYVDRDGPQGAAAVRGRDLLQRAGGRARARDGGGRGGLRPRYVCVSSIDWNGRRRV